MKEKIDMIFILKENGKKYAAKKKFKSKLI
jgi:hypothetical protein